MPDYLKLLEVHNRTVRVSTTGTEISTTWYCEPASAAALVIAELVGGVSGNTTTDIRYLPAHDFFFPYCYCVSAHEVPADARAIASGPPLSRYTGDTLADIKGALCKPPIFDGPRTIGPDGDYQPPSDTRGMCGAFIEAIYRPLSTIYNQMPTSGTPDVIDDHKKKQFDYLDPQFTPCSKTIDVKSSLYVLAKTHSGTFGADIGSSPQISDTWQELTIRRVMCPTVPWSTIGKLVNRVNERAWTPQYMTIPGLPSNVFHPGTLRFDYAEVTQRILPAGKNKAWSLTTAPANEAKPGGPRLPITSAMRWYDILLKFSWRTTFSGSFAINGAWEPPHHLSWNYEWYYGTGNWTALANSINPFAPRGSWPSGWYESGFWSPWSGTWYGIANKLRPKYLGCDDPNLGLTLPPGSPANMHYFDMLFLTTSP